VRVSLLRAPLYPDPEADQGPNSMRVSLRIGAQIADAVAEGYRMNLPLREVREVAGAALEPLLRVDNPAVVVEAVKAAEDRSGDVVVRLYEAYGGRARAVVSLGFDVAEVQETDLLERPYSETRCSLVREGSEVRLQLRPFQLVTLRLRRPGQP
jgi:alpha-mannosidase